MKKTKALLLLLLAVFILFGAYFLMRPYWRFSFDSQSPFEAISVNTSMAIGLDIIGGDQDSLWQDQLWALDVKSLHHLLDSIGLEDKEIWREWWMVPEQIEQGGAIAYTFIGNGNSAFSSAWKAADVGIPVNYGEGEIYGFQIESDDPLYFTRSHNLFIVGKYPFQIEETLSLLKHKNDTWQGDESFEVLKKMPKDLRTFRAIIHENGLSSNMPDRWMSQVQQKTFGDHFDWLWMELDHVDSVGSLTAYIAPKIDTKSLFESTSDWQWVPEICQTAIPIHPFNLSEEWLKYIESWIGEGGWELTLDGTNKENKVAGEIWVLPIQDTSLFIKNNEEMLAEVGIIDRIEYQRFQLVQLNKSSVFTPLSDRKGLQPWLCELDGALLCAVSKEDMERWLDYYMVGGQLNKETAFLTQQQTLGNAADLLWRWNPLDDSETSLFKLFYPSEAWTNSGQLLASIEKTESGFLKLEGMIQPFSPRISGPSIAWTKQLQLSGDIKLFPVKDIYTEQTIAIALQDELDHLVFMDENGNILWERPILAPIVGSLYAIPWHNGIMHLLAITTEGMQLWDENGSKIDRLPPMNAPPSSDITIAHFSQKGQVGVFTSTANGQVWGFTPEGELMDGWPVSVYNNDTIVSDILHYQLPSKDLIVSWSDSAGWKAFDKKGLSLFEIGGLEFNSISPPFGQQLSEDGQPANNRLVMAYDNGVVQVVSFAGESFSLPLGKGPADHFLFSPIWGDARSDYIVQRGKLIHLFAYEENTFSERWKTYFPSAPDTIIDMAPYGLIAMNNDKRELWLLDGDGQFLSERPLAGQQDAFLLNTSTQENLLLTLLDKELYVYHLEW